MNAEIRERAESKRRSASILRVGRGPIPLQIGLATFGILALELALIRWIGGQVRVFAYFNNLVLIGAFFGMGLGVALGRKRPGLVNWTLPILLLTALPIAFSEKLGIVRLSFPDPSIAMWGAEIVQGGALQYAINIGIFMALFSLVVLVFIFAASVVGHLFPKIPTLRAYSADLTGSLLGVVAFTVVTFFHATPPIWLALGSLPFLWLSRRPVSLIAFLGVVALGAYSVRGAVYSPYNRIDLHPHEDSIMLQVNRDFHQYMHDLSDENLARHRRDRNKWRILRFYRTVYDLPFQVDRKGTRALIVGAGTGNDVQAALRNGYREIVSVDIDGRIISLGKKLHPEKPYDHPGVIPIVNDARAFFEQYEGEPFDCVNYGLLDSHAMFSSMSSLRLDNYVYTVEGIRAAWKHVSNQGYMSISFSLFGGPWIADRLYWTITEATGTEPVAIYHGMHSGATFLVAPDMRILDAARVAKFQQIRPRTSRSATRTPSDDWPFLYVRPGTFPWGYVIVLSLVLVMALIVIPPAFGGREFMTLFDPTLFFMGAAFLLIETRGVTSLSLLFGSTWLVNASIFSGILLLVLLANMAVEHFRLERPLPWFGFLFLSVLLLWAFDPSVLNHYSLLTRGIAGGLINALPVGFAGVIVSILLFKSKHPATSLGSNLLGSVIGGCLEYLSMLLGLSMLAVLAAGCYMLAVVFLLRGQKRAAGLVPAA